jgi:integrase
LDKLFKACNEEERLWFEFFLMTGMREQEVMHTYWSDVNFAASTVRVSHKPDRGWTPKAYKEREIPIRSDSDILPLDVCSTRGRHTRCPMPEKPPSESTTQRRNRAKEGRPIRIEEPGTLGCSVPNVREDQGKSK